MSVTLVKLGGSLITNKSKPFTLKETVLTDVVKQLAKAWSEKRPLIIGHGAGSFAHVPAEKYRTIEGKLDEQSLYRAAVVADAACQLNRIVVSECLKQNIPALSISPLCLFTATDRKSKSINLTPIMNAFENGFVPVVYGDVIMDSARGFTIWSTEMVLNTLALALRKQGVQVGKVIHTGETDGFLKNTQVVGEINSSTFEQVKTAVLATEGFDVTGGMLHKVEESLRLAQEGIDSYIVGGNHGGNLYRTIVGSDFIGTRVTK